MVVIFILCCLCWIGSVGASHFFVTAPNVLRFNHDETILINTFGAGKNFRVETWLKIKNKEFSRQIKIVANEKTPVKTTIKVTEDDLQIGDDGKRPPSVQLYAKTVHGTFNRKLLLSYDTGYILLQTSKPLYHPNEKVEIRALAMTESLKAAKGWNISMDIISPSKLTFGREVKPNAYLDDKFFENSFELPPHAEEGLWTIKAFYGGQYQTEGRTHFQVKEYVLPTFGVTVDVKEKVIKDTTDKVTIEVTARYVYKKPVRGKAVLKISCLDDDGTIHSLSYTITRSLEADGSKRTVLNKEDLDELKAEGGGFASLEGQRLLVSVRVIESVTGKEEVASNKRTVFSSTKYKFNFDRSKKMFRPGLSYYLRVSLKLASGDDPGPVDISVKISTGGKTVKQKTDEYGSALLIFQIPKSVIKTVTFEVAVPNETPEDFVVNPYSGEDQIHVDQLIRNNGEMTIKAIVQGIGNTGVMTLLISRGQYIDYMYFEASTDPEREISQDIQERVSPEARAVSFFISKSGNLVADSTRFQVTPKCRGKGLTLKTKDNVSPEDHGKLTVTGSPNMGVGLNIMDKALLLLDSNNVLRKSKMFQMMKSHDLGCGEGGGTSAENVFHDAGVTVVTNYGGLDSQALERQSIRCGGHSRKKRSLECDNCNAPSCCLLGEEFAFRVIMESDDESNIDVMTTCYARTMAIARLKDDDGKFRYSMACLKFHFVKCVEVLQEQLEDSGIGAKSANDDSNDYLDALKEFNIGDDDIPVRKNFRDSWLFTSLDLDEEGNSNEIALKYPSSITEWMIQAVGITENQGFCIAEPKNVTAFKPVFIQLDMPYTTSRLEYLDLKVTVFNYKEGNKAKFRVFLNPADGLCIGADDMDTPKLIAKETLSGSEAFSVRVPVLPLRAGRIPIRVTLTGRVGQEHVTDAIEKHLLVVNEGIEERESITVCLEPFETSDKTTCVNGDRVMSSHLTGELQTSTINMTLPANALIDTGSAFAYATSNVMDDVVKTIVSGIDNMLRKPWGCGEQTMLALGPSVYVMSYWKNTKQLNSQREKNGYTWIRNGVNRELTFRKTDGSYAAWIHRPSSTWLTAFVGKVFCQAKKVVDGAVNVEEHIVPTIGWLNKKMDKATGAFKDARPVIHRNMVGQIKETDPSLTAYVLITLLECDIRTADMEDTKIKATGYLEKLPDLSYRRNPYLLAISSYALALAKSKSRLKMKDMLLDLKHKDDDKDFWYWGNPGGYPANAGSIETTAYAMLALMQYNNGVSLVKPVVRWLTHQRSAAGSFRTTQDTVIGLQALSEYTIKTFSSNVKLDVSLEVEGWGKRSQTLSTENQYLLETIKDIPVKQGERTLRVATKGQGSGKLVIDYRYNRPKSDDEQCAFHITDIEIGEVDDDIDVNVGSDFNRQCDVCGCGDNSEENDDEIFDDNDLNEDPVEIKPKINRKKREADDENKKKQHCVTFSVSSLNDRNHGMSIIDVGLETGMQVVEADLKKLKEKELIDSYEMPGQNKGFFILYIDKISKEPVEFKFRLEEDFTVEKTSRQPSRIHVYDYYQSEYECIKFYGTGPRGGSPVEYKCEEESNSCSCLKTTCPDAHKVQTMYHSWKVEKKKPAKELLYDICVRQKATFAAFIEVKDIKTDHEQQIRIARATVEDLIHKGSDELVVGNEIELFSRIYCDKTLLEKGEKYYLISTDGDKSTRTDGTVIYKYQLMGPAVVIKWTDVETLPRKFKDRTQEQNQQKTVMQMMKQFKRLISKGCSV